ncbi:hypothetical protein [Rhizobium sp. LEGMi135b]
MKISENAISSVPNRCDAMELVGEVTGTLWREPNRVYRIDGRVIPVGHKATLGVDHCQSVVGVHNGQDMSVGLLGLEPGVHVK